MSWTDEQKQVLIRMWDDGYSDGRIAEKIGKTRNAVLGMRNRNPHWFKREFAKSSNQTRRNGRPKTEKPKSEARRPTLKTVPRNRRTRTSASYETGRVRRPGTQPKTSAELARFNAARVNSGGAVNIMSAQPDQCRFPVSGTGEDLIMCGAKIDRGGGPSDPVSRARRSYCPVHGRIIVDKPARTKAMDRYVKKKVGIAYV